eukprot:1632976-Pyramimonas_sp.AAC.1
MLCGTAWHRVTRRALLSTRGGAYHVERRRTSSPSVALSYRSMAALGQPWWPVVISRGLW